MQSISAKVDCCLDMAAYCAGYHAPARQLDAFENVAYREFGILRKQNHLPAELTNACRQAHCSSSATTTCPWIGSMARSTTARSPSNIPTPCKLSPVMATKYTCGARMFKTSSSEMCCSMRSAAGEGDLGMADCRAFATPSQYYARLNSKEPRARMRNKVCKQAYQA